MSARFLPSGMAIALLLAARPADAYEDEWHGGVRGGFATLAHRGTGPAAGIHGAYGLSDMFDLTIEGLGSWHPHSDAAGDRTDVYSASAGLIYKVDVLEWIPYFGIMGGYYYYAGRPGPHGEHASQPGGAFQLGVDYLFLRNWAATAEIRWHASFSDGFAMPLFSATLGAEYRWGF